jgi:hypothetical protein
MPSGKDDKSMRRRARVEPEHFRVEVWFDEESEQIQIKRTDPGAEPQYLACTFEQWEQIKYAVEHLFKPLSGKLGNYEVMREVATTSRN